MVDREKVISTLEEIKTQTAGIGLDSAVIAHGFIDKVIALLKEQESIKPYIDIDEAKCPICKVKLTRQELLGDDVLFEDFFDYCPHCGRQVKWECLTGKVLCKQ